MNVLQVTDPASQLACNGDTVIFSVIASGRGPFFYQWFKGASPLADGPSGNGSTISGATTNTLTITDAQAGDAGSYTCQVMDSCTMPQQTVSSGAATLDVNAPPARVGDTLMVEKATLGTEIRFTWIDLTDPSVIDYFVFEDTAPNGPFTTETGSATSGMPFGLTVPMPAPTLYFLVAGRNAWCVGPKK